ncbi:hypothetical protein [Bdellovibrio svalbardensis]|uniref:Lipoprotein n=1 Tax=Bdellovibrio svalbardensis TaxID=2972972 RepID=A0ABT6DH32_9BACT|nr:hypothetical protein [Bdellovibrio svalbardensis]MDG0816173.1 hypothetical protein [Bdellovibrio svalbardensis]
MNQMVARSKLILLSSFTVCAVSACAPSENPISEDLIKTSPPTFSGLTTQNYTTPSVTFELNGECDTKSFGLEYSFDEQEWIKIPDGCLNGTFKIGLTIAKSKTVFARALTKKGRTSSSQATVRLVLPPTSPAFQTVTAGLSSDEGSKALQFTMSSSIQGKTLVNADFNLNSNVVGVVYGSP